MKFNIYGISASFALALFVFIVWQKLHPELPALTQPLLTQTLPLPAPVQSGEIHRAEAAVTSPQPKVTAPHALDSSDDAVRSALNDFAPQLVQWLTPAEQIRKWVMSLDAIADGSMPTEHLPLEYRIKPFQGESRGEKFVINKTNFERATPLIDAIIAIPPERLLQYYQHWSPLLERAYRELGHRDNFDNRLRIALSRINAARPLPDNVELTQAGVYFVFTDPQLEKASDLEKWLWRIGPTNTQHLQTYLQKFREML